MNDDNKLITIEFIESENDKKIFIDSIGVFLIGFGISAAIHIFITSMIILFKYMWKKVSNRRKKNRLKKLAELSRGGSSDLALPEKVYDITQCIKQPGAYEIVNVAMKEFLRKQLQNFVYLEPLVVDPLAFLVAFYSVNFMTKIKKTIVSQSLAVIYHQMDNLLPILAPFVFGTAGYAILVKLILPFFSVELATSALLGLRIMISTLALGGGVSAAMVYNCADYVRYLPTAELPKEFIDVGHFVILPEKRPDMIILKTDGKNSQFMLREPISKEVCQIPKNAGLETVEPRGPFRAQCSREHTLKPYSAKIHKLKDFESVNNKVMRKAEKADKTLEKKLDQNLQSFEENIKKEKETKISIYGNSDNNYSYPNYDE